MSKSLHPFSMFGCYNPHRHEFDPILQAWIYGGPKEPTFWEERNRELADDWCEYKGITREQGISEMKKWQKSQEGKDEKAIFVTADGTEIDIVKDILGQNKQDKESDEELDPAFLKLLKKMNLR